MCSHTSVIYGCSGVIQGVLQGGFQAGFEPLGKVICRAPEHPDSLEQTNADEIERAASRESITGGDGPR